MQTRRNDTMIPILDDSPYMEAFLAKLKNAKGEKGDIVQIDHLQLNQDLREALVIFLEMASNGHPLYLVEDNKEYSTNEAAEVLRVSRTYLNKLLERNEIPYRNVGSHKRIEARDLFAYKEEQARKKREAFEQHAALGQRL